MGGVGWVVFVFVCSSARRCLVTEETTIPVSTPLHPLFFKSIQHTLDWVGCAKDWKHIIKGGHVKDMRTQASIGDKR